MTKFVIGEQEMARIKTAFAKAAERASASAARRERKLEDILHGDVPTFMELPVARTRQDLAGADAAIVGFGYEGITIKTPWLSAPSHRRSSRAWLRLLAHGRRPRPRRHPASIHSTTRSTTAVATFPRLTGTW